MPSSHDRGTRKLDEILHGFVFGICIAFVLILIFFATGWWA